MKGKGWFAWAGLATLLVAGQLIWAIMRWDSEGPGSIPAAGSSDSRARETLGGRRRIYDAFPPIVRFDVDSIEEAGHAIDEGEQVLGVEVGGESRAYPLNMLGHPGGEVVNDTLGGVPVAVTFCGLCETPSVFSRGVDGQILTFFVTGVVVDSNMLLKDVETHSGWVQLLGRAVEGPLQGKVLDRLPSTWTDWKTWRAGHPRTTAIRLSRGTGKYSAQPPGAARSRKRAFTDALQWGLAVGGRARSWSFARLAREQVVNDAFDGRPLLIASDPEQPSPAGFDRRLDGRDLTFHLREGDLVDDATGSTWDPSTGLAIRGPLEGRRLAPVAGTVSTTAAWRAFYPDGEVWDTPDSIGTGIVEGH